jgi:hypothetical protein
MGSVQLHLRAEISMANDRFDQAVALAGSSLSVPGSTLNSTLEPGA